MRKILSLAAIGLISGSILQTATAQANKDNSMAKKNLAAYHVIEKAFQTGNTSEIDRVVASDFVDHTERGDMDRDSLKAMIVWMHRENPDMKLEKIRELADDEYVMAMRRYSGTSAGEPGMPPRGESYSMSSIEVVRFKNGKAVEHWTFMEMADMIRMMGPQMGTDNK